MKASLQFLASTNNSLLWLLLAVVSLLLLWGLRMPGGDIPYLLAGAALVVIAVFIVIVRIITRLILVLRKRPNISPIFAGWRTWILFPGAIFVIGLIGALGLPFRLAFAVSRPQLEQLVQTYSEDRPPKGVLWAGLFPISSIQPSDGALFFTFRKSNFPWKYSGVYYSSTDKCIEPSTFTRYERIEYKWFSWHYSGW